MAVKDDLLGLVKTSFSIVALYLLLRYATGAGGIVKAGSEGWVRIVKALQAR